MSTPSVTLRTDEPVDYGVITDVTDGRAGVITETDHICLWLTDYTNDIGAAIDLTATQAHAIATALIGAALDVSGATR